MAADAEKKSDASGKSEDGVKVAQELESLKWVRERRSIREFTGEKISDEHIELILEAARHAPSPENMLMMRFVVIRDDQDTKEMNDDERSQMKDPVLFGYIKETRRLYFIADWEDEHCDLTFDEMIEVVGKDDEEFTLSNKPEALEE